MRGDRRTELEVGVCALKMKVGAMSQGIQVASKSKKRQENRFSPRALEGTSLDDILSLAKLILDLQSPEL